MSNVQRINLGTVGNLELAITESCDIQETAGFKLAGTFVFQNELVLIFQN